MATEKLNISVFLAERKYMITVSPEEEPAVRNAVDFLNQQVRDFSAKHAFKDRQDILAMISLLNTTKMLDFEKKNGYYENNFGEQLQEISALLDHSLE